MSVDHSDTLPGGDSELAGEYVLGLLEGVELHAFEAQLASDPALQAEVAAWAAHLSELAADIPEVAPAPAVLRRIEIAAFGAAPPSFWRQLWPYVLGAAAAAALAWVATGVGLVPMSEPVRDAAPLTARLESDSGGVSLSAAFHPATAELVAEVTGGAPPPGRILFLWAVPEGGTPRLLGQMPDSGPFRRDLPLDLASEMPGAGLAVSAEAEGTVSPAAPLGPIVARGLFTQP